MKSILKIQSLVMILSIFMLLSCSDDDTVPPPMGGTPENPIIVEETITYDLGAVAVADISGKAIFKKNSDNTTTIELELDNTPSGGQHPAHIHINTAAEGGAIALTLGAVDGNTGMSSVTIAALDDGTAISFDELVVFDGYINVHLSTEDLATIVAQGDIGQNALTGVSKTYDLNEKAAPGIEGTVTFFERINGEALSLIELINTPEGGIHPAHIHNNSAIEGGGIAISLNPIDGNTGISKTNIDMLDDGSAFSYSDVLVFDGYINVHLSAEELGTIVAQGDIGQNELTGMTTIYELGEKDAPGISGMATFYERKSGEALAVLELMNTPAGGIHPAHIHENDAATGGPIALSFNPVNGDTGSSMTHIDMLDDGTLFGYGDVGSFNGYINVHLSADNLGTIVAQGNIGSNKDDDASSGSGETFNVTNQGASAYIFNGGDFSNESNPDLTLKRGVTYEFDLNTPGHPFLIKTTQSTGTGDTYTDGVSNNGAVDGKVTFTVPMDAPDSLFYICEIHSSMSGAITIVD